MRDGVPGEPIFYDSPPPHYFHGDTPEEQFWNARLHWEADQVEREWYASGRTQYLTSQLYAEAWRRRLARRNPQPEIEEEWEDYAKGLDEIEDFLK